MRQTPAASAAPGLPIRNAQDSREPPRSKSFAALLCYFMARVITGLRLGRAARGKVATLDVATYRTIRVRQAHDVAARFGAYFDVTGKRVLDFGCGTGGVGEWLMQRGAASVVGIDTNPRAVEFCRRHAAEGCTYLQTEAATIPLPDSSIDCIVAFDVFEHVNCPRAVLSEWQRVLRPQGTALIYFAPYWSPTGAHVSGLLPIPWVHVLFPESAILRAAARIYDAPWYVPSFWDLDEQGRKKPNPWRALTELPNLNKITIAQFDRLLADTPGMNALLLLYSPARRLKGFARTLAANAAMQEYLTTEIFCVLQSSSGSSQGNVTPTVNPGGQRSSMATTPG